VEVNDEVDAAGLAKSFRDEERDGVVRIMLFRRVEFAVVSVTLCARRMREGRGSERREDEPTLVRVSFVEAR